MPYYNVGVRTLYETCRSHYSGHPLQEAMAWIEAEDIVAVWKIVQAWFERMEDGTARHRFPDPFWDHARWGRKRPLTQQIADRIIAEMDADFEIERARFPQGVGPEFARLPPHARLAFAQEVYGVIKTEGEIEEEATRRTRRGERFPNDVAAA